ncbi:acetate/propionate family kinase [Microvirga pudoricolor]|uniref:acetate/propionate family kinase n=1 Tax=Microvirga pudoricolor TaxID=2778729 RepID=UPI0019528B7E|nr:acetate/propionate family kinase [Microvirga pudoricolor]MBM6595261.1 acetate/propionate family kinase [Microvirga pudoricolor]
MVPVLIVLNAGSSSLKFQVFDVLDGAEPQLVWKGLYEGLGGNAHFVVKDAGGIVLRDEIWDEGRPTSHEEALTHLVAWLSQFREERQPVAIGHRVVHGGEIFSAPAIVDESVLQRLEVLVPLAPLHQPHNLEPIRIVRRRLPEMPQVACFDTAFHQSQSDIATLYALPREMRERGVRRYGFHGLSYDYISSVLEGYDQHVAERRVVVAHLGNGASLCALKGGVSIATTMGFSALDGLPMGTRCGTVDAGVVFYMLREMSLSPGEAERLLYTKSGLLGVSGISNDMRTLRAREAVDTNAKRAIEMFVYRIVREIGSLVAALGGIEGIVFTGGIGENDGATRAEVIEGLAWAGFTLDDVANRTGGPLISSGKGPKAWVIPTNEELVIARQTRSVLSTMPSRIAS